MSIRKGRLADAEELLVMLNATRELQPAENVEAYTLSWVKACITEKDKNLVLVYEKGGKIAGFLMAEIWKLKKYSFLSNLYVNPAFRKEGVAGKLQQEYENYCKRHKLTTIMALVLLRNRAMRRWCEKHGYAKGHKFFLYEKKLVAGAPEGCVHQV